MFSTDRRNCLRILGIGGTAIGTGSLPGIASIMGSDVSSMDEVLTGVEEFQEDKEILVTGFEPGDVIPELTAHTVTSETARSGKCSITGEVRELNCASKLLLPLNVDRARVYRFSFYAKADRGSTCAVWLTQGKHRECLSRVKPVGKKWRKIAGSFCAEKETQVTLELVGPSSWGGSPGKMWLDDLSVVESPPLPEWPPRVQSFPALTADKNNSLWLATLDRPKSGPVIDIFTFKQGKRVALRKIAPGNITGLGRPALAPLKNGCVATFAVELNGKWRIAYSWINSTTGETLTFRTLETAGQSNIRPTVAAAGETACILWQANEGNSRGIYAARVGPEDAGAPRRVSAEGCNSYNPHVTALKNGSFFAAWDSLRNDSADIFGTKLRRGHYGPERRLTSGKRIERHPYLATRGNEIWMTWQAQAYPKMKLNFVNDQRVAVARLGNQGLEAPLGLFKEISTKGRKLMRPRIGFDSSGKLWLTARRSVAQQAGWLPVLWSYDGRKWSDEKSLLGLQGRWQPLPPAFFDGQLVAAIQYDNLPKTWTEQGKHVPWKSGIRLCGIATEKTAGRTEFKTEPLTMPETDFSMAAKRSLVSADLPRQQISAGGRTLSLFWGDFHDHTDLSVCQRQGNPPGHDLFANLRDIEKMDFCALTDHGYNFDWQQWDYNGAQTRANHDPERFITFLGEEWTSSRNPPRDPDKPVGRENARRYGHHNLVFLDPYHEKFYDAFDGEITPAQLWENLKDVEFLCIPHQLADWKGKGRGNPPTDWSFHDEHVQPVAEIFQARQSYEYLGCPRQAPQGAPFPGHYLQDAWAKGLVIGTIASPDHGGGNGKIGVWAENLNREEIFKAVQARHTFGTSGAKMALLLRSGKAIMGDKIRKPDGAIRFHAAATAKRNIKQFVIFRNNQIAHEIEPNTGEFEIDWTDDTPPGQGPLWYYARIHAEDDELAWSSPIWFV